MATICPTCLHPNPPDSSRCSECSRSLAQIEQCAGCKATVFYFSNFCYHCGVVLKPVGAMNAAMAGTEHTADLDPSESQLTGDILDQENSDEFLATTFHSQGIRLLHRSTSTFYDLPLLSSPITIGKRGDTVAPDLDLRDLPEAEFISRNHAQISFLPQKFYIEDLGSKNGTALNGVPLPANQPQTLAFGDELCFGGADAFKFIFIKDQPLNLDHLKMISGHDRVFEVELLNSYLTSVTGLLAQLDQTLQGQDFTAAKTLANQIAISSYNVGADVMNLLAKQMEDQALQQATAICEKTLGTLREGLSQVNQFVKVFYGT